MAQQWRASVTFHGATSPITDDQADTLVAALPGFAIIHHNSDTGHIELSITVQATTLRKAVDEALRAAQTAYADALDLTGTPVAVRVLSEDDHLRELAHPDALDLVGITEIAEMAGVTRQRAQQLTAREDFPAPVAELRASKVYTRKSVEKWLEGWARVAGWAGKHAATSNG